MAADKAVGGKHLNAFGVLFKNPTQPIPDGGFKMPLKPSGVLMTRYL